VAVAIVSSVKEHAVDEGTTIMGEVGLGGEIRSISHLEQRLNEVGKLGFQKAMVPARHVDEMLPPSALKVVPVSTLAEAFKTMGWQ
jgi:DNA repair protein RadA/Sms